MRETRTNDPEVIGNCASRIIESGALGRSETYVKLLRYLVDRAMRGEVPKEFDISVDVFGKAKTVIDSADAQTRVHIHKLRARLDAYYAGPGEKDPYRLDIPKGTYHLFAVSNDCDVEPRVGATAARRRWSSYAVAGVLAVALVASVAVNVRQFLDDSVHHERRVLASPVWSGLLASPRPLLVVVGDHFFFGDSKSHLRMRDVGINSHEELRTSVEHGHSSGLVYETLSYLPKSTAFALHTILPYAAASGKQVSMKLVSELTSEDLRDYDVIYVGFVRAMAILRDYYFTRSNFTSEAPLFMSLAHTSSGEVFTRSGPVPQYNSDYGLFARFTGPGGNQILVFAGIGDVGVSAIVRFASAVDGLAAIDEQLAGGTVDASHGFEVLVAARGHSRTDLDGTLVGAYALRAAQPLLSTPELPAAAPTAGAVPALSTVR